MALVLGSLGGAAAGLALVAAVRGNYLAMTLAALAFVNPIREDWLRTQKLKECGAS
jgi:hypothetical protein